MIRRREFITLLGGAAVTWPLSARAQQFELMRRVGILVPGAEDDSRYQAWVRTFQQALAAEGWIIGRNLNIDTRFATDNATEIRKHATDLVALGPDVILAHGASTVRPLLMATRSVPIVFPIVADPVAAGFVDSLARPGGNVTGFMTAEYGVAGKWLELLKEIAPTVRRAAVFRDPAIITGASQFAALQAVSPFVKMEVSPVNVREASEIERDIADFARSPDGGLIITSGLGRNIIANSLWRFLPDTNCLPSTPNVSTSPLVALFLMELITLTNIGVQPVMSTVSSEARNPPTCRCSHRRSTRPSSISRPLIRSASTCRRRSSLVPTR
jgi:ABC-type uncharacterized transport system substrate-binding protein